SLVVGLDVVQCIKIVHHQAKGLFQRLLRKIAQVIEAVEARSVAEMEMGDRIERTPVGRLRPQEVVGRERQKNLLDRLCRVRIGRPTGVVQQLKDAALLLGEYGRCFAAALALEPGGKAGYRRERYEGFQPRQLALELLDHLLDQEVAERN